MNSYVVSESEHYTKRQRSKFLECPQKTTVDQRNPDMSVSFNRQETYLSLRKIWGEAVHPVYKKICVQEKTHFS